MRLVAGKMGDGGDVGDDGAHGDDEVIEPAIGDELVGEVAVGDGGGAEEHAEPAAEAHIQHADDGKATSE